MNTQILQKCIEELKSSSPKIDYILGMLETVVAMSGSNFVPSYPTVAPSYPPYPVMVTSASTIPLEEGSGLVGAYEHGPIAQLTES